MAVVLAVSNQKGGVGKTTSSVSISAELALAGNRVLLIDFDPQASATSGMGCSLKDSDDLYDMFFSRQSLANLISDTAIDNLKIIPASKDLVSIELELGKTPGRELILKTELATIRDRFDVVVIDCPPSSGLLSLNALGAADYVLVPLQAEYYALEGLSALMDTIEFVKATFNPELDILGVFITMYDARTNLSVQVEQEAKKYFSDKMFTVRIPRNIRISESPSHSKPICHYAPGSPGAVAYRQLSNEIVERMARIFEEQSAAN